MINEKIKIGQLELGNRLVMPPMATWKNDAIDQLVDYYQERAGKIGLIIMEFAYVSIEGRTREGQISIAEDSDIERLKRIVNAVHAKGTTKIFAQINHAGIKSRYEVGDQQDIQRIIQAFSQAALRAKKAGFDGVEVHASHGYLLNQFYSPLENHRKDEYSSETIENRTRLTKEVIEAVRKEVGNDYPISVRFGGCDYEEGGSTIEDASIAAPIYEKAGANLISVSGGMNGFMRKDNTNPGWFSDLSTAVKKVVSVPVLLTGGITTQAQANQLISQQAADLIGVGRPLLKEVDSVIHEFLG